MPELPFRSYAATDVGRRRAQNQDLYVYDPERGLFGVIDGVGGHAGGEVAARLAWEAIHARFGVEVLDAKRALTEALVYANNAIVKERRRRPELEKMGCVATIALAHAGRMVAAHVGDARLYKLRPPAPLAKLTHDHSLVGVREDEGELSELEAMRHPRRNEILRDLGAELREPEDEFVDVLDIPFEADAAFLICTDGLTDLVPRHDLEQLLLTHAGDPRRAVEALIDAANARGGTDNITAVVVEGRAFHTHRHASAKAPVTHPTGALSPVPAESDVHTEPAESAHEVSVSGSKTTPHPLTLVALGFALALIVGAGVGLLLLGLPPGLLGEEPEPMAVPGVGRRIVCASDAALQPCLDGALPGDTLVVPAGTQDGPVRLPAGVVLHVTAIELPSIDTVAAAEEPAVPPVSPDSTLRPE